MNPYDPIERKEKIESVTDLAAYLRQNLSSQVRDIQVVASEGGVVLRGKTNTYYAKQLAQELFRQHCSLRITSNEIEVFAAS